MGYGYIRERSELTDQLPRPQVTSLADVTLVLLVIFMTTATASMMTIDVPLPAANNTSVRDVNLATSVTLSPIYVCPVRHEAVVFQEVYRCPRCGLALQQSNATAKMLSCPNHPDVTRETPLCAKVEKGKECKTPMILRYDYFYEDDRTPIEAKNVWTALRDIKGGNTWNTAIIKADKATPCEHVNTLVQCLQGLGVEEISFQMDMEEKSLQK